MFPSHDHWQLMHKAMGVLFRPITYKRKGKYLIEDYESSDKYDMKNITLDIVLGSLVFFYDLKNELKKAILTYLATQKETEVPQPLKDLLLSGDGINQSMDLQMETYLNMTQLQKKTYINA